MVAQLANPFGAEEENEEDDEDEDEVEDEEDKEGSEDEHAGEGNLGADRDDKRAGKRREGATTGAAVEEWVEVMKKHKELAGRLELLASGVGLGAGKGASMETVVKG